MRVPKLAGRPGRGNQSPGSGGAPKFKKNCLPFACSPYDPDHFFPSKWLPTALRGTPLIGFACRAFLLNAWEQLYFFQNKETKRYKALISFCSIVFTFIELEIFFFFLCVFFLF